MGMKKRTRKTASALLTLVFLCGGGLMLRQMAQYRQAEKIADNALLIAANSEATPAEPNSASGDLLTGLAGASDILVEIPDSEIPLALDGSAQNQKVTPSLSEPDDQAKLLMALDIEALQQVNGDVLGWLHIPDTEISYPLLSSDTYDEYLYKAWDGTQNANGSIYLECTNRRDFSDFNSILYGHNLSDGTMFGSLKDYGDAEFLESHRYIYIAVDGTVRRYVVFASYMATVDSKTYWLNFSGSEARADAIAYYQEMSHWTSDIQPTGNDRILTLSTCSGTGNYTYRWVVQAVLDTVWETK